MTRLHPGSTSRSRFGITRSPSTRPASTSSPSLNVADWPSTLLRTPPSTDGGNISTSPSEGSRRVSSSNGEHSPSQGNEHGADGEDIRQWHEAFIQENDEPDNTEESVVNDDHLLPIEFNSIGQPIKEGSKQYATKVGKIVRNIISPAHEDWRNVPWELKEEAWRSIKNVYRVPEIIKDKFLKMANVSWKNRKTALRRFCDKYDTVAERKSNNPGNLKREDWEAFVDMHNSEKDKKLRLIGKTARKQLKALHSTGRDGIARRRLVLEQQSPTGSVTRSVVYLATHVYQEIPEDQLELFDPDSYEVTCRKYVGMVRELYETEQYREETHLDRDAVALVFGTDDRGCVRGVGGGISKTELIASALPREQLRQEQLKTRALDGRVRSLEETVGQLKAGLNFNPSTNNASTQEMINGGGSEPIIEAVVLRNMKMKPVAFGRLNRSETLPGSDFHLVLIDEIVLPSQGLCDDDRTFADVYVGESVMWPKHSVCKWPITRF